MSSKSVHPMPAVHKAVRHACNSPVNKERLRDLSIDRDVTGNSGHDEDVTGSSTW